MLEQKLYNTDGLNKLLGEQLVWFDGFKYHLTATQDPQAEEIRKHNKHWVVYLTGDVDEDIAEIQRQTFLSENQLDECLCDIGTVEDNCGIEPEDIILHAMVNKDGDIIEDLILKEHLQYNNEFDIASYEVSDDNTTKTNKIIAGAVLKGYTLEMAYIWVMKLGYMAQDKITDELMAVTDAVQSWTI